MINQMQVQLVTGSEQWSGVLGWLDMGSLQVCHALCKQSSLFFIMGWLKIFTMVVMHVFSYQYSIIVGFECSCVWCNKEGGPPA